METGNVLCSTPYYMAPPAAPGDAAVRGSSNGNGGAVWEPEQLLSLALSDAEDILIGGYDTDYYRCVPLTGRSLAPLTLAPWAHAARIFSLNASLTVLPSPRCVLRYDTGLVRVWVVATANLAALVGEDREETARATRARETGRALYDRPVRATLLQ